MQSIEPATQHTHMSHCMQWKMCGACPISSLWPRPCAHLLRSAQPVQLSGTLAQLGLHFRKLLPAGVRSGL